MSRSVYCVSSGVCALLRREGVAGDTSGVRSSGVVLGGYNWVELDDVVDEEDAEEVRCGCDSFSPVFSGRR